MNFDEENVKATLNKSWSWKLPRVMEVLAVNSMGNCLVHDINDDYWRICPEDLYVKIVARSKDELEQFFADPDAKADWQLLGLIDEAVEHFGVLEIGQCYGMIKPAIIGGDYSIENLRVKSLYEYLALSGSFAYQIRHAKDGDKVKLCITQ